VASPLSGLQRACGAVGRQDHPEGVVRSKTETRRPKAETNPKVEGRIHRRLLESGSPCGMGFSGFEFCRSDKSRTGRGLCPVARWTQEALVGTKEASPAAFDRLPALIDNVALV
jgi:hypothetical protein